MQFPQSSNVIVCLTNCPKILHLAEYKTDFNLEKNVNCMNGESARCP